MRCVIKAVTGETGRDEVSRTDLERIQPGAIFEWTEGYRIEKWGQKDHFSMIQFVGKLE